MDMRYPPLKRPAKRKLSYFSNQESSSNKLPGAVTCGDVDKILDDLDSRSHDDEDAIGDPFPPSPPLESPESDKEQIQRKAPDTKTLPRSQTVKENVHATKLPSSALDVDVEAAFKDHWPSQTSSPIDDTAAEKDAKEQQKKREGVAPPVVNGCEDKGKAEAGKGPAAAQKPQNNLKVTKNKESHAVQEKAAAKPPVTADLASKGLPPQRQEKPQQPVASVRQEPEFVAPKKATQSVDKHTTTELSSRMGSDLTFLQKLREAHQPKPAPAKNIQPPPPPPAQLAGGSEPEPEDDFLILEDDSLSWFSLTSKIHKKRRLSLNSITEKSSVDNKSPAKTQDKQQRAKQPSGSSAGGQDGAEKARKTKKSEKKSEKKNGAKEAGNYLDVLCSPQAPPGGDVAEQEDEGTGETDEGGVAATKTKRARAPSDSAKGPKPRTKGGQQNAKKSRAKPPKPVRKAMQGPEGVKDTAAEESQRSGSSEEPAETEDLASSSEKETNAETDKTSSEAEVVGKRKRRPTGQWWLCSPASAEETEEARSSPTLKKRRRTNTPTSRKTKKDPAARRRIQTPPARPASQSAAGAKEKKSRRERKRSVEPAGRRTSSEEEAQEEPDPGQSSPSVLAEQHHSHGSEKETTTDAESVQVAKSTKPPHALERSSSEDKVVGKRKRKPTSRWWLCNPESAEETEEAHSSPTLKKQKPRPSRRTPSLTTPTSRKTKKDKAAGRRRDQTPASPPSSRNTARAKEKKSKREGKRSVERADRRRSLEEDLFGSAEAEQQQDLVPVESSPVADAEQEHSLKTPVVSLIEPTEPLQAAESAKTKRSRLLGSAADGTSSQRATKQQQQQPPAAPRTFKRTLATFTDLFTAAAAEPPAEVAGKEAAPKSTGAKAPVRAVVRREDDPTAERAEPSSLQLQQQQQQQQQHATPQESCLAPHDLSRLIRSGPSSIIDLQRDYADDFIRPSSTSDLCGPPLKPLILISEDKDNLQNWLDNVWSSTDENSPRISVDHFEWFYYRDRALGFQVDLNSGSISNGKILMGQYSIKPLWVDHSTTTVYNLLSSSVSVTIDGRKSCYYAGQSFMVPCGHAYSIQNVTSQPAVLYFTRLLVESSD